jgi:hypothetical protein
MSRRIKKFDVRVVYDPISKRAVDLVGPGGILALGWNLESIGDTLSIDVISAGVRLGKRFIWTPSWLWPFFLGKETFRQQVVDDDAGIFSIRLQIDHPIFGPVFGYNGTFCIAQSSPSNETRG